MRQRNLKYASLPTRAYDESMGTLRSLSKPCKRACRQVRAVPLKRNTSKRAADAFAHCEGIRPPSGGELRTPVEAVERNRKAPKPRRGAGSRPSKVEQVLKGASHVACRLDKTEDA
uniref:Uncharacterized protein n=1 Tax=Trichuris muris TaxID=70415 RepID=A0A5S6QNU7_TRIMR